MQALDLGTVAQGIDVIDIGLQVTVGDIAAIGFQIAAAGLGFALLPALGGVLAKNLGLEIIGPFLLAASVVMFLLHEVVARHPARSLNAARGS